MVVILRLSLGCHFLYEGLWKIRHAGQFSAAAFLAQAKGPTAWLVDALLPDPDGRRRLGITESEAAKPANIAGDAYSAAWADLQQKVALCRYKLDPEQIATTEILLKYGDIGKIGRALRRDRSLLQEPGRPASRAGRRKRAAFQQQRLWDQQQKLRQELGVWLADLDLLETNYQNALWNVLDDDQQARGWLTESRNPLNWRRIQQIELSGHARPDGDWARA